MRYFNNDEYIFDPSLEDGKPAAELKLAPEYPPYPEETAMPSAEDSAAPEYGGKSGKAYSENEKAGMFNSVRNLAFMFVASVIAALSILFAASGADPLGNDFLMAGAPSVTPTSPSSSSPSSPSTPLASTDKKTPVSLPVLSGKVTYEYYVTYAPTGDKYSGTETDESAMETDVRSWVSGKGGDPDTVVLYDYKIIKQSYETSSDAIIVGDLDNIDSVYVAQGSLTKTYTLEVYYEGYAKESSSAPIGYTDSFPDLPNLDPDFEGNYAWTLLSPSPGITGGSEEYLVVDSVYLVAGTFYSLNNITDVGTVPGATYDKATNTLTLENFHGQGIDANLMGNGFKIKLVGENSLDFINLWGAMYGGSVTFTGNGSIKINENLNCAEGIYIEGEYSASCIMIDREATVEVFGEHAIVVHCTTLDKAIYTLQPIKMTGGKLSDGEFVEYTYTVTDENGNPVLDENGQMMKKTMTVKDLGKERGVDVYDYSVVGEDGKPSAHVLFAPEK